MAALKHGKLPLSSSEEVSSSISRGSGCEELPLTVRVRRVVAKARRVQIWETPLRIAASTAGALPAPLGAAVGEEGASVGYVVASTIEVGGMVVSVVVKGGGGGDAIGEEGGRW